MPFGRLKGRPLYAIERGVVVVVVVLVVEWHLFVKH